MRAKPALWVTLILSAALAGCSGPAIVEYPAGGTGPRKNAEPADNSRCFVCHGNYLKEQFAAWHAKVGVGCESCHGMCDPHANDEQHLTAPDIIYGRDKVASTCHSCHPDGELFWRPRHWPVLVHAVDNREACTDCHGKHRLAKRKVRWDKNTRELIPRTIVETPAASQPAGSKAAAISSAASQPTAGGKAATGNTAAVKPVAGTAAANPKPASDSPKGM